MLTFFFFFKEKYTSQEGNGESVSKKQVPIFGNLITEERAHRLCKCCFSLLEISICPCIVLQASAQCSSCKSVAPSPAPCLQLASVGRAKSFVSAHIIIYHIHIYSITYSIIGSCLVFPLDCEQILLSYSYFFAFSV